MLPVQQARAAMRDAEAQYVQAARALESKETRETHAAYRAAVESLIAAYDSVRLVDPRHASM